MAPKSSVQTIVMVILHPVAFSHKPKSLSYGFFHTTQFQQVSNINVIHCNPSYNLVGMFLEKFHHISSSVLHR